MKTICYTVDVEADHDGIAEERRYDSLKNIGSFKEIVKKYDLKVTGFVTGHVLDKYPEIIKELKTIKAKFECHSYSHKLSKDEDQRPEIERARKHYKKILGKYPRGYRAPFGVINEKEIQFLKEKNFKFDSSLFTSIRPGLFNNTNVPNKPHYIEEGLLELPMTSVPYVRIPIALSYIQLFGWNFYKTLFALCGTPDNIVFDFHFHDLYKSDIYNTLPIHWKVIYLRNRLRNDPVKIFEKVVAYFKKKGYASKYIEDIYEQYTK